ncbi:hypothetical protein, variant 2 [Verruconis gallopava]|uniref:Uncharacterized protein n=1 Tax=Verruconis gallopava TaxID=253628 RepID=A0A0D2A0Y5_9PEZI|nr:uncharacterized protein PV09_08466 [Verruconis gallopava]XP_016209820.1 hypothetical protein, variant 1 [Verruconis gallopava]XP_016209821.1 hypothetical protein, variant 2 [Verruconis gallopava]KIV99949.1 hypothetical protein PV09_08466 [Verruconis gallopava]KIV99950.1 hypothetical protein, variant 1 [Verruconis gallopava]KIV99951.1 hypothetical protein, variant 2 [Verruconis gallopava]
MDKTCSQSCTLTPACRVRNRWKDLVTGRGLGKTGVVGPLCICAFVEGGRASRLIEDAPLGKDRLLGKLRFDIREDSRQHCSSAIQCFYRDPLQAQTQELAKLVPQGSNTRVKLDTRLTWLAYKIIPIRLFLEKRIRL